MKGNAMKFNSRYLNVYLALYLSSAIAAGIALILFDQPFLAALLALPAVFAFVRENRKASRQIAEETTQTDLQLRQQVIETQKLAFSKLASADDQLKTKVAELLADAAKHLAFPYLGGQTIRPSNYILLWNQEGLTLVAQARQLIDGYTPGESVPAATAASPLVTAAPEPCPENISGGVIATQTSALENKCRSFEEVEKVRPRFVQQYGAKLMPMDESISVGIGNLGSSGCCYLWCVCPTENELSAIPSEFEGVTVMASVFGEETAPCWTE
jgi:hypothetical protein